MKWNAKETIANISRIVMTTTLSSLGSVPAFSVSLAGGLIEGAIKGIETSKEQIPLQNFRKIIQSATQKALNEISFELPVNCETTLISTLFSADNAIQYLKAPNPEKLFEETITNIISSYHECDTTTVPIKKIAHCILQHIEAEIPLNEEALILQNNIISKQILQIVQEINKTSSENQDFPFDILGIHKRSALRLKDYQSTSRFSYYDQCIDPTIIPDLKTYDVSITYKELISWIESHHIKRIQLIGEGGTGKTSLLLSLWEYLITNDQYSNYFVNMIKLNQINNKSKNEADQFLLHEFAKNFLFDDTYLTKKQLNDALKILLMTDQQVSGYKYLLLLDGFNEVQLSNQTTLIRQLLEFDRYQNVIIILTSRFTLRPQQMAYDFFSLEISALNQTTILKYLKKHKKPFSENFGDLLDNPMMLTVYCETDQLNQANLDSRFFSFPQKLETKYDLMKAFFEGLACKEYNLDGDLDNLVQTLFINNYVLPYIASQMGDSYTCPYQDVKQYIEIICDQAQRGNPAFNAMFYERDLEQQWAEIINESNLCDIIRKYLLENPTVFVGDDSRDGISGWIFIHQEYRDYCQLKYCTVCLENLLIEDGTIPHLSESQLISAALKIRKKVQNYPNIYWLDELEELSAQNIDEYHSIGSTNIYAIIKIIIHTGFRQIEEMNETVRKQWSDSSYRKSRTDAQAAFLFLIDCMNLQSILVGTSNFKEQYLDALFKLEGKTAYTSKVIISYKQLEEVVSKLAEQLKKERLDADFDIQLPTNRQIAITTCTDKHSPLCKIIISSKGSYGRQYKVLGVIHELYPIVPTDFKDYIAIPGPNDYKALHVTIYLDSHLFVRVIIRQTRKLRRGDD